MYCFAGDWYAVVCGMHCVCGGVTNLCNSHSIIDVLRMIVWHRCLLVRMHSFICAIFYIFCILRVCPLWDLAKSGFGHTVADIRASK